jgi:GMP reductase
MEEFTEMNKVLNYKDVLLKHKQSIVKSRSECDISTTIAGKIVATPVFCSNMTSVLNYDIVKQFDENGWFYIWPRTNGKDDTLNYIQQANTDKLRFVSISVGVKEVDKELLSIIKKEQYRIDSICIDVALIFNTHFEEYINWVRQEFPNTYLIAGNCDSYDAVIWLQKLGVDCAKVFIGVSESCRTKQYTGFASSTLHDLNEIDEYFAARKNKKIKILADGGLTVTDGEVWLGDIAKAIRFGADFVMSGRLFAHCKDNPASSLHYHGNASKHIKGAEKHVEGVELITKSNDLTILEMMKRVEDSLKSSVSYAGGTNLSALKTVDYHLV